MLQLFGRDVLRFQDVLGWYAGVVPMSGCSEFHLFSSEADRSQAIEPEPVGGDGAARRQGPGSFGAPGPGIAERRSHMQEERIESAGTPAASTERAPESLAADQRLTWTVPEVARLLGISKDSAYEAVHRGELPVRMIGRRVLVPRAALLRLLDGSHTAEQVQQP
jgi:excisionase family DNA binding protein